MNVKELIKRLSEFDQELEVMILDDNQYKQNIRKGPVPSFITIGNAICSNDCKGREEEKIIVIGYET